MKNPVFLFIFISLMLFNAADLKAQSIVPDAIIQSQQVVGNDNLVWYPEGTTFCTYNGDLYMFVWVEERQGESKIYITHVFKYSETDSDFEPFNVNGTNSLIFGYPFEQDWNIYWPDLLHEYYLVLVGNTFSFSFHGSLWYYSMIQNPNRKDNWYELWAQLSPDGSQWSLSTVSIESSLPPYKRMGAIGTGDTLKMIYYQNETKNFYLEDYTYNDATHGLKHVMTYGIPVPGSELGGVISYPDVENNNCYVYSTYIPPAEGFLTFYSPVTGWHTLPQNFTGPPGITNIIQGSICAQRPTENLNRQNGNRFTVFDFYPIENSDKTYTLYADEWMIPADISSVPQHLRTSTVTLPAAYQPDVVKKEFGLGAASLMSPEEYVSKNKNDGLQQKVCVFYPGAKAEINGALFDSDIWRPVPGSVVSSTDLDQDQETMYGKEIRNLWTLIGITDGAPPCSIDWPVWESLHTLSEEPTELKWITENVTKSELSSSYEDKYSVGTKIDTKEEEVVSMESSFKYSKAFKSKQSSATTLKTTLTLKFGLNETSQENGWYIWAIPQIQRVSYQVYPWWDKDSLKHPITNSLQYQFSTPGILIKTIAAEISGYPFLIDEPNDPGMAEWKGDHRTELYNSANYYDLQPIGPVNWTAGIAGEEYALSETSSTSTTTESASSYEQELSIGAKLPEVFKISASESSEVAYSSETQQETEYGTDVEVSLVNLINMTDGINIPGYNFGIYWFKPDQANWWYMDSLGTQRPWYIGYIVNSTGAKLEPLSPAPGSHIRGPEMLFSWKATGADLHEYKFFIADAPAIGPGTTIYKSICGDKTAVNPVDFLAEPGMKYYWAVRGMTDKGEVVWSKSQAFSIAANESVLQESSGMMVNINPNPAKNGDIFITFDLPEPGPVSFILHENNGRMLREQTDIYYKSGTYTITFPVVNLSSGVYFMVVRSSKAAVTNKLIIIE
jgi:hypothetical protein